MATCAASIEYTVQVWQEGDAFIAHAMPLDVISAGETPEKARLALDEAVRLFLKVTADMDTLTEVLEEAGYRFHEGAWTSPAWVSVEKHTVAIGA